MDSRLFDLFKKIKKQDVSQEGSGEPYLIVGLGNPGREYEQNRHNIGFMVIDHLLEAYGLTNKKVKSKAIISDGIIKGRKVYFAKPQTYMNLSGQAVGALMRFYKVPLTNLMVIHDDLDLPFGTVKMRPGGGAGGQKGINSIIQHVGDKKFARVRFGIGRPPGRMQAADYVLQNFNKEQQSEFPFMFDEIKQGFEVYLQEGIDNAMNRFNGAVQTEGG